MKRWLAIVVAVGFSACASFYGSDAPESTPAAPIDVLAPAPAYQSWKLASRPIETGKIA